MLRADPLAYRPGRDDAPAGVAPIGPASVRPVPVSREAGAPRLRRLSTSTALAAVIHVGFTALFLVLWRTMVLEGAALEPATMSWIELPADPPKPPAPAAVPSPPPAAKAEPSPPPSPPPPADPSPPAEPSAPSLLDQALKPALAAPPPEAKAAATQAATNQEGHVAADDGKAAEAADGQHAAAPQPPAAAVALPEVTTRSDPAPSISTASKEAGSAPPSAGDPGEAGRKATAQLAAALPMSAMPMPLSFRAALSAQGSSNDANYRGSVFGALERARQEAAGEAQARRLKGQVVLAIVLTATGAIDKLTVVQSSGSAAADAFAIEMVRRAAPFPPPPPGASRTFTPAIAFGEG